MNWEACCPRPQLQRASFLPLSDGWTLEGRPIRVPWPPQSALSGYSGRVGDVLHYETHFTLPEDFLPPKHRLLVHFGAVDQAAEVWLNGVPAVRHEGGYLPFSADITSALRKGENRLTVTATDTLSHKYPYGKQHKRPHGMWYTPVSGIWQAVWLEAVPERGAVASLRMTPDLAGVTLETDCGGVEYTVDIPLGNGRTVTVRSKEKSLRIDIPAPRLWSPEDPYLYRFTVTTETDRVESYFALRTVTREERGGRLRICLNGRPVFLHAVLDQGYFPDGLFLPSAPEAYERDILRMKELGFNTLRKHVKIEPEAFYHACDRLGMLVLQDMVNSGGYGYLRDTVIPNFVSRRRSDLGGGGSEKRKAFFERHCLDTVAHLQNHPCIVGWTIFNEGWGQYDSDRICRLLKGADPARFFVSASGWFAQEEGDVESEHIYFSSRVLEGTRPGKFLLLSECGGIPLRVEGHTARNRKSYGYGGQAHTPGELTGRVQGLYDGMVLPSVPKGLCGCIYTQLSDVEGENNGLYTYDRQVRKVSAGAMLDVARRLEAALAEAVKNG